MANFGNKGHIRYKDTPERMADRIPPSKDAAVKTAVEWTLGQKLGDGERLFLIIHGDAYDSPTGNNPGRDPDAGEVFFVAGGNTQARAFEITSSTSAGAHTDYLWADKQTKPGNAGKIKLDFEYENNKPIKSSAGFSVAAIPVSIKMSDAKPLRHTPVVEFVSIEGKNVYYLRYLWGYRYTVTVGSDSLDPKDLDEVNILEKIANEKKTGAFEKMKLLPSKKSRHLLQQEL